MKLLTEIRRQFSLSEWLRAFFNHTPTAGKKGIKGGYRVAYSGGTSQEIFEALNKLKQQK